MPMTEPVSCAPNVASCQDKHSGCIGAIARLKESSRWFADEFMAIFAPRFPFSLLVGALQ
eukprot:scaffold82500_cov29-Tisochrysis_lutea.AAC.2